MTTNRDIWTIAKSMLADLGLQQALDLIAERCEAVADNAAFTAAWKQIEAATRMLADNSVGGRAIH